MVKMLLKLTGITIMSIQYFKCVPIWKEQVIGTQFIFT